MDGCRDDNDELPLVYLAMNLLPCKLQELTFLSLVLIRLEFTIRSIESACTSLLLHNPNPLIQKQFKAFSETEVRLEYTIRDEGPLLLEATNHLQRI